MLSQAHMHKFIGSHKAGKHGFLFLTHMSTPAMIYTSAARGSQYGTGVKMEQFNFHTFTLSPPPPPTMFTKQTKRVTCCFGTHYTLQLLFCWGRENCLALSDATGFPLPLLGPKPCAGGLPPCSHERASMSQMFEENCGSTCG